MDSAPQHEQVSIHGHSVSFLKAGSGPAIVLIHGVAGRSDQWLQAMSLLSERFTVIAPDLLGHGRSAKPRGDYSLGSFAAGVRDLLIGLGHERATIVGHSLGGGIAMQFAYQFPDATERLVLASSGGLGREVHLLLRAATLPGSELVLPVISHPRIVAGGALLATLLTRIGLRAGPDLEEMARGYESLGDAGTRQAFVHTLRAVIDPRGQRVSAVDRLYLAEMMPSLIVWGRRDPIIPVHHAGVAHRGMPGSELVVLDEAGHFPQLSDPITFSRTLTRFIESTEPAHVDIDRLRELVLSRGERPAQESERPPAVEADAPEPESSNRRGRRTGGSGSRQASDRGERAAIDAPGARSSGGADGAGRPSPVSAAAVS